MKIDKIATTQFNQTQLTKTAQQPATEQKTVVSNNTSTSIDSQLLTQATQPLSALPDVDMAKVEQIKTALNRGEISLDVDALSSAILQFHTRHE
ncbi:flagellar biosynthesis anti-sigma factor FlgM [Photobacterium leiognathi]|uniref:flagellar biosynthesis anti-sigma factor FlgM n=1 Tax=Photobacterium leiognathi TaxID=553611 RepID=UPI0027351168|nr:flagellar biosynthesis anti-sigma factor FlgM [Photobacterium leiognathi]